ncbi:hypothetical protein PAPYR_11388 [Paratrimastix pyriformis]|uniref:Uncharacterized protein n=1 Tax=Paratrimastix pyriformis TaxID=342808 RepID=A0ABQ8U7R7_9EUKA|nr:hypothetical protein PAPYR_11388 [Paratrimastix pyriformis]
MTQTLFGCARTVKTTTESRTRGHGFNTNGWFKHTCPEANRSRWTSNPACGFYRRTRPAPTATAPAAPAPGGWEFLQGVDFGGCDICCRADLCNNIEALKAHAATLPGCVLNTVQSIHEAFVGAQGFNTNGWFKHACPEANRGHWTSDPACGFYRRTDGWEFLQGIDSDGCDICCRADLCNNIEALKAHAATLPNCVGFNTLGWFKHACPEANRGHWTSDPACGFYRRTRPAPVAVASASDGWEFLQGDDYGGCDICCRAELRNNIGALKAYAQTLPNCVGFNTNGWFKHACPEANRGHWTADLCNNIEALKAHAATLPNCVGFNTLGWFKHACPEANRRHWTLGSPASDGWEFLQGDDFGGCDIYCRADLCNNIEALKAHAATLPGCVVCPAPTPTPIVPFFAVFCASVDICHIERSTHHVSVRGVGPKTPNSLPIWDQPVAGFNTNGWFKHACPEANRGHWTSATRSPPKSPFPDDVLTPARCPSSAHSSDPACGFYRRVRPAPELMLANLAL